MWWNSSTEAMAQPAKAFGRTRWAIIGIVVGVIGSSLARTGLPKPKPAGKDAGSAARTVGSIDGTVRSVTEGVQEVSASVRGQFDRTSTEEESLKDRVADSLQNEAALDSKEIDVSVADDGVVILKGEVANADAKELAVGVARELRGVGRVEDHLAVTPKPRVFGTPSGADRSNPVARQASSGTSESAPSLLRRLNR